MFATNIWLSPAGWERHSDARVCTEFRIKWGPVRWWGTWWANGIKGQSPAGHKLVSIWGVWSDIWSGATQFRCMQAASLEVEFHFQLKATVQHSSSEFGSLVRHLVTSVYQCLLSHLRHRYNIRLAPPHGFSPLCLFIEQCSRGCKVTLWFHFELEATQSKSGLNQNLEGG